MIFRLIFSVLKQQQSNKGATECRWLNNDEFLQKCRMSREAFEWILSGAARTNQLIDSKISFGLNERYAAIPSTDP